ncbi:hypothetical protein RUND412_003684 [Rhizina undulata]
MSSHISIREHCLERCTLSTFESLPQELIQKIYLLSSNPLLPIASSTLSRTLTSDFLRLELLISALTSANKSSISAVLNQSYCTLSLLLKAEAKIWKQDCFWNPTNNRFGRETARPVKWMESSSFGFHISLAGVEIPGHLLHAPFTKEKHAMFKELLDRGARVNLKILSSRELVEKGFIDAIRYGNVRMLKLLGSSEVGFRPGVEHTIVAISAKPLRAKVVQYAAGERCGLWVQGHFNDAGNRVVSSRMYEESAAADLFDYSDMRLWEAAARVKRQAEDRYKMERSVESRLEVIESEAVLSWLKGRCGDIPALVQKRFG